MQSRMKISVSNESDMLIKNREHGGDHYQFRSKTAMTNTWCIIYNISLVPGPPVPEARNQVGITIIICIRTLSKRWCKLIIIL